MSEIAILMRLLTEGDREVKTSALTVTESAVQFNSQLSKGYKRKGFAVYNASNDASGELFYGDQDVSADDGYPVKKAIETEIPLSTDVDIYFVAEAGQTGDLRVFEMA